MAEAVGRSSQPRCQLVAGMLGAVFTHLAGRRLVVREALCSSRGDARCTFVVVSRGRAEVLEEAIARGDRDVEALVRGLGRGSLDG